MNTLNKLFSRRPIGLALITLVGFQPLGAMASAKANIAASPEHFRLSYSCNGVGNGQTMQLNSEAVPAGKGFLVKFIQGLITTEGAAGRPWLTIDGVGDYHSELTGVPSLEGGESNMRLVSEMVHLYLKGYPSITFNSLGSKTTNAGRCQVTLHGYLEDL